MVPIADEFHVPLTAVAVVFTITLWMRLIGAVASGRLADRVGRKKPLVISILWYSICNCIAGFAPGFRFLLLFRALLGIGMGAEWPAGAALAMESWPARSRGFMTRILQASWGIGFLLSSLVYGLFYQSWGWRGMLWVGILPALAVLHIRRFVKEPAVWVENRKLQRDQQREVRAPLTGIFKPALLANTLTACWWMAGCFIVYHSIWALFTTHWQKDLGLSPGIVATPIAIANLVVFLSSGVRGVMADRLRRRWSMIAPALIAIAVAPTYLLSRNITWIIVGFVVQGAFGGGIDGRNPSYLAERFPTEVRATASAFCYHQGAIWGGFTAPVLVYFASAYRRSLAIPMLIGTVGGLTSFILAVLGVPETKGKVLVPDLVVT